MDDRVDNQLPVSGFRILLSQEELTLLHKLPVPCRCWGLIRSPSIWRRSHGCTMPCATAFSHAGCFNRGMTAHGWSKAAYSAPLKSKPTRFVC